MNPLTALAACINSLGISLWRNHSLILRMTRPEAAGRYKGSLLCSLWSFLNPFRFNIRQAYDDLNYAVAAFIAWAGLFWFQITHKNPVDVL